MPIFKYTVANKEGKTLNGTIEAPDEQTARVELNNLGFSIISLEESTQTLKLDPSLIKFVFEALDKSRKQITGTIPSKTKEEALVRLQDEYELTVTAIWKQGAAEGEILRARQQGIPTTKPEMQVAEEAPKAIAQYEKEQLVRNKVDYVLKQTHELLKHFEKEIDLDQKAEIDKKINKLLRIKGSTNLDYVLTTAREVLKFIQSQEKFFKEKGLTDKRIELTLRTKSLLDELNKDSGSRSISAEIVDKIDKWEKQLKGETFIKRTLNKIKNFFTAPPEIKALKEKIKVYNRQLWELASIYFKEPTPEYKSKIKTGLKTVWKTRRKTKLELKKIKTLFREKRKLQLKESDKDLLPSFTEEISSFSGWLLVFYLGYYFTSLYLTSKDFGFINIPKGFGVYDSHLFKYILAILFLLHITTALKSNFFKKSLFATIILIPTFIFGSIIVLLNY